MKLTQRGRQHSDELLDDREREDELWRVNWRALGYPFCGIYAISPDNRWPTKVGISQNPVKRLINLQGACWKRLDIAAYRYCENFNTARLVEKKAHETLKSDGKLMSGEWFDVRPEQALEVIEFSAQVLGIELRNDIPDATIGRALGEHRARASNMAVQNMYQSFEDETGEFGSART